jgi:hypothetical protein
MKNNCDGKKCDDTAVPCSFAKQVIFSLESEKKELREELDQARDSSFYTGMLVCLQVLHQHDTHVQATEIVNAAGGIQKFEYHAKRSGSGVDADVIRWLKTGKR